MNQNAQDDDEILGFLDRCETCFKNMTIGVIDFLKVTLPEWLRETWASLQKLAKRLFGYLGKIVGKVARVAFYGLIWASLSFLPLTLAIVSQSGLAILAGLIWAAIAIVGSAIGYRKWKSRQQPS